MPSDKEEEKLNLVRKLMNRAKLEMEATLHQAEWDYWEAYSEFHNGKPEKFLKLLGITNANNGRTEI